MANEELEKIRKEIYRLEYYFEKMNERFTYLMSLINTTCYNYDGKAGIKIEEEVRKELEEAK